MFEKGEEDEGAKSIQMNNEKGDIFPFSPYVCVSWRYVAMRCATNDGGICSSNIPQYDFLITYKLNNLTIIFRTRSVNY